MCEARLLLSIAKPGAISPPPSSRRGRLFPPVRELCDLLIASYAAAFFVDQLNLVPSIHIQCRMTASFRATATLALRSPLRFARRMPQALSADHFATRVSSTLAAS